VKLTARGRLQWSGTFHNANMVHYRHLIAESKCDPKRDEDRHKMLLTLLAEEVAKDQKPLD
jgi:hypothetical protein